MVVSIASHRAQVCLSPIVAGLLALTFMACGARSGFTDTSGGGVGGDDDMREGSCAMPIELAFEPQTVRGRLLGGGSAEGWCGEDGSDSGREDTYLLTPPYSTDVILTLREGTDFPALLRVTADACVAEDGTLPETCVIPDLDDPRHFWAEAGRDYYISIDSEAGIDGRYELDIAFGWPPLESCDLHSMVINQQPGGIFLWENTLASGQGRVDGACGGPGRENMFLLNVQEAGLITVNVSGSLGIRPVVSVRSSCAAASELICASGENPSSLEYFFPGPGEYYLVVDQEGVEGGDYVLEVYFS